MKKLDNVTLVIVDTKNYGQAAFSLLNSLKQIEPARTIFFTDTSFHINDQIEVIKIPTIHSKEEYSIFIFKELYKYIETDYVLVTQWDSGVLNGDSWDDQFFDYDYVAPPWIYETGRNIGNGGFSLRSKKLQTILGTDDFIDVCHPEDQSIGIIYRNYLEQKYDIQFPEEELADTFGFEIRTPICKTFGYHGFFHKPYQETVIIHRTGAMGDVIALEPLLHYYFKKGYRVVLDTLPQFHNLFIQHYFKVHSPNELDQRLPVKEIDLDMSYETKPKQLHLKSYFEYCGIEDYKLTKPKLTLNYDLKYNKLFKKYCVIHIDERPQPSRNIYGIKWVDVVLKLESLGYTVIQIGMGEHQEIGAIEMATPSEPFLMWLIGGADLFIGIDSGPANIAVAMDVPAILFFGSVNPEFIHPDLTNVHTIQVENACDTPMCWHNVIGCEGQKCVVNEKHPPCVQFSTTQVLDAIKLFTKKQIKNETLLQ